MKLIRLIPTKNFPPWWRFIARRNANRWLCETEKILETKFIEGICQDWIKHFWENEGIAE